MECAECKSLQKLLMFRSYLGFEHNETPDGVFDILSLPSATYERASATIMIFLLEIGNIVTNTVFWLEGFCLKNDKSLLFSEWLLLE